MRADCPECGYVTVATLTGDGAACTECGTDLNAGDIETADDDLTEREWDALGKQGDPPEDEAE